MDYQYNGSFYYDGKKIWYKLFDEYEGKLTFIQGTDKIHRRIQYCMEEQIIADITVEDFLFELQVVDPIKAKNYYLKYVLKIV